MGLEGHLRGNLAASRSHCSLPAASCLLLLSCVFPTLPCRHWCVSECVRGFFFFFFFIALCFCNPKAKAGGGWRGGWGGRKRATGMGGVKKKKGKKEALRFATHGRTRGAPRLVRSRCAAGAFRVLDRASRRPPGPSTSAGFRIRGVRAKSSPPGSRIKGCQGGSWGDFSRSGRHSSHPGVVSWAGVGVESKIPVGFRKGFPSRAKSEPGDQASHISPSVSASSPLPAPPLIFFFPLSPLI